MINLPNRLNAAAKNNAATEFIKKEVGPKGIFKDLIITDLISKALSFILRKQWNNIINSII